VLLYYITDRKSFGGNEADQRAALLRCVAKAARAGLDYIQLREKDLNPADAELLARQARHLVRENSAHTKFLISTHAEIALSVGADGVHLPAKASPVASVREYWLRESGHEPVIGVSVHTMSEVQQAQLAGARFAVLAPIFEKVAPHAIGIGLDALREACCRGGIPVLALGGVSLANAGSCLDAGAAGVAGVRLFQQGNVSETVRALRDLAKNSQQPTS